MAGIQEYLDLIKNAVYGREVRQAIHDGIQQCYYDGKAGAVDLEARERISSLATLVDGSTTGDAELIDGRTVSGKTYTNIGDAIRSVGDNVGVEVITGWTARNRITTGVSVGTVVDISGVTDGNYESIVLPCQSDDVFTINGEGGSSPRLWAFTDSDYKLLECSTAGLIDVDLVITAPSKARYLIINRGIYNHHDKECYKGDATHALNERVSRHEVTAQKYREIYVGNLLDESTCIRGGKYNSQDVWVADDTLYSSALIPCYDGEEYAINYAQSVNLYDKSGNLLGVAGAPASTKVFTAHSPYGVVGFFRVYGLISQIHIDAVYRGNRYHQNAIAFPYGETFTTNTMYRGKTIITYGDSRTWYDGNQYYADTLAPYEVCMGYQSWIRRLLDCNVINEGRSGYTTPQIRQVISNSDVTKGDIITIAGGVNDFLHDVSIGSVQPIGSTFDTNTVCGALQSAIEDIYSRNPDVKLMLITSFAGWIRGNKLPETYIQAKRDIAKLYSLPLLDLYEKSGVNELSKDSLIVDDPSNVNYQLHLNNRGNEIIGRMVAGFVANGF